MTPFPLAPMEPVAASRLPEGTDWAFQAKWDGIRLLAAVTRRGVRVCNRRGRDRTAAYPELGALRDLSDDEAVYDGEAVILAEGRPSFPLVMRRELAGRPGGPSLLYVLFDCLGYAGRDLRERPWEARQEVLAHGVRPGDCVRVAGWTRRGQVLWEATARAGWEGVVAKRLDSPYRQGARSGGWIKVKHRRRLDCVVGGYAARAGAVVSLAVGLYAGADAGAVGGAAPGVLVYVGRVASGLDLPVARRLADFLPSLARATPPFANPPAAPLTWVEPLLTVRVAFLEWTPDLKLRQPSLVGFPAVAPAACWWTGAGSL